MRLGHQNIRKWVMVLSPGQLSDCPTPLLLTSMIRARMCELIAEELKCKQKDACFTVGLFSALDAIMGKTMEEVASHLPLSEDIISALVERQGEIGNILALSLAWEENTWDENKTPHINQARMQQLYLDAIEFGEQTFSGISRAA